MTRHRSHSIAFKRQVAQEFISGATLHRLAKRHDLSRNLIRLCVQKFEAGAFDEGAKAANRMQEYEARIARWGGLSAGDVGIVPRRQDPPASIHRARRCHGPSSVWRG
ncbi:hypothetical protein [Methylopila turkensis]|uniref:Transposase n=1 Tax=Methylopila turkensis TaxID=1437816 RepID=A0A9W6JN06_9HYPH|nr:hypothetical protein [Methylopila turkensis]GLK79139.1 hypothetical protein GCM10008174_08800 [Methylopila turkensis]